MFQRAFFVVLATMAAFSLEAHSQRTRASLVPGSKDTIKAYFDTTDLKAFSFDYYISNRFRRFEVKVGRPLRNSDQIDWRIDSAEIQEYCVDTLADSAGGAYALVLRGNSPFCYPEGRHFITLAARFSDTVVNARWNLNLFKTEYFDAEVDLHLHRKSAKIDSYTVTRVAAPVDGRVFNRLNDARFAADWQGKTFTDAEVLHEYFQAPSYAGNPAITDVNVFVTQVKFADSSLFVLSNPKASFIQQSNPPYSIQIAMSMLDAYIGRKMRLGPILRQNFTSVTAKHDAKNWSLREWVGGGDCPSGCTFNTTSTYSVLRDSLNSGVCVTTEYYGGFPFPPITTCYGFVTSVRRGLSAHRPEPAKRKALTTPQLLGRKLREKPM